MNKVIYILALTILPLTDGLLMNSTAAAGDPAPIEALTTGPRFHWFGYYDKFQFDPGDRYVLGMQVDFEHRSPTDKDVIKIGMIDLEDGKRWVELGESRAWCWQQGCMLQWRPGSDREVLWNDREGDRFVCRILDVKTRKMRTLSQPIYHISPDGKHALGADFARTQNFRPGYGYPGVPDKNKEVLAPRDSCVYLLNLDTGDCRPLVSVSDIARIRFKGRKATRGLYFNHIQWSPDGKRFLVFNRGSGVNTHVYTAAYDGTDIRFLAKDSSHYQWRDPKNVLIWAKGAYRLYKDDGSGASEVVWKADNGHQSYLPGKEWILTDTYPMGAKREQVVYLHHVPTGKDIELGRFHSPGAYRGEWRCDTHPRLSRDGAKIVIDSPHGGNGRQMYIIDISGIVKPARVIVKETRRKEDTASVTWEDGAAVISVTSRSGIGSMTLVSPGRDWPARLRVRLQYEDGRPFRSLEGFDAALSRSAGKDSQKVGHRIVKSPRGVSAELSLPEGKGFRELKLRWIDAYR